MSEPLLIQHNCFNSFNTLFSRQSDSYKTYDPTTGNILNCYYSQKGPMEISLTGSYTVATAPNNITQYQNLAKGGCDLAKFPEATFPEVYESFNKEYEIFQKLYVNNLTGNLNTANLIPTISGNNISCSGSGYIPHILEYFLDEDYSRFARFCATQNQINKLEFSTIGDYNVYTYLDSNTNLTCQSSSCTTSYPAFVGHNLNPEPIISSTPNKNNKNNTLIIIGFVVGVIVLLMIGFLLWFLYRRKYNLNKNKHLNKKLN